ncbi:MAG TPA: hypothetical protein VLM85_05535 [Polyangiaceae bacterium]|nr:hypothetical protein [Polyangiaceae bacterium]
MRRSLFAALTGLLMVLAPGAARAAPPSPGSWAAQLTELAALVKPGPAECSDHCWVLERLRLSGSVDKGSVAFELQGQTLQKGSYDIPLFGPAAKVRLEDVTENGARATLGFEDGHWYVHTSSPRFVVRGTLVLPDDRTVGVVGPLDALDADLRGGRLTEGAHLTALAGSDVHFDAEGSAAPPQPPVFSIARALRVGKTIEFEYKLTAQAGADLGVLRLPLRYGERVVDVAGSTGWRVEGEELLLPTTSKSAAVTVSGTLPNVASLAPDPRSAFEWWLLESDPEHRVLATGDARQHDSSESPIARREPNSRLFLVQRGQHLEVTVQTLQSLDVLAATVRSHSRTLVLTSAGDLVAQDELAYDNNGLDYLYFTPTGKPLYLATDGASERVMHKDGSDDVMIPMRFGQHSVTVQSLAQGSIGTLFGRITLTGPRVPLASSSEQLTLGLPTSVHAVALTGGDTTPWPLSTRDLVALALSVLASLLLLRTWRTRGLGAVTLSGLWLVSQAAFAIALAAAALLAILPAVMRMNKAWRRALVGLGAFATLAAGAWLVAARSTSADSVALDDGTRAKGEESQPHIARQAALSEAAEFGMIGALGHGSGGGGEGTGINDLGKQLSRGSMLDGVRPVSLSMPAYVRSTSTSRQLVTQARPFTPTLYYVTDAGLALLGLSWLGCAGALAFSQRDRLRALRDRLRAAFAPAAGVASAPVPAPAE